MPRELSTSSWETFPSFPTVGWNIPPLTALVIAVFLHLLFIIPWQWPFTVNNIQIKQPYLQANLQPIPAASSISGHPAEHQPHAPSKSHPHKAIQSSQRMTSSNGNWQLPTEESTDTPSPSAAALAKVIEQPTPPEYPVIALRQGLEGCVLARIDVSDTGSVIKVSILASDQPGIFDQSVIDSQQNARYLPAQKDGRPQPSQVLAVATFVLTADHHLNCALKYVQTAQGLIGGKVSK